MNTKSKFVVILSHMLSIQLSTTTSTSTIVALKTIFSRQGIPDTLVTDNGRQYSSAEFRFFSESYNFKQITSSP